jgi:hypothetical protein
VARIQTGEQVKGKVHLLSLSRRKTGSCRLPAVVMRRLSDGDGLELSFLHRRSQVAIETALRDVR